MVNYEVKVKLSYHWLLVPSNILLIGYCDFRYFWFWVYIRFTIAVTDSWNESIYDVGNYLNKPVWHVFCCFQLKTGKYHLSRTDGFEQELRIKRLFKHPRYNVTCKLNYDVALLELNGTLKLNNRVGSVCLPDAEFDPGTICYITGWGKTSEYSVNRGAKVLQPLTVNNNQYMNFSIDGYPDRWQKLRKLSARVCFWS